ncbi:isoprenylcysteine carboxylmethyltransferase family protein [Cyanobium sp. CH-040]|uniref:methyltransferase family protein n=1 Tax=Cyanobium sp. CH-040 TaxID=2823708 RepID=UPI0020CC2752|nr:isoprenylcysteine carboxylmethyltransferase family protein [Cyanobium sp. CH-040]MCP9928600.1 isoprenylcysteine carboxylmethyltransferase family protein [Cyanobium sp. CH-040]
MVDSSLASKKLASPGKSRWERARTRLSKAMGLLLLLIAGMTQSNWELHYDAFATLLYALGLVFVAIACTGRIWCSFYLSGRKDSILTTEGPYSLSRNPLYFCSALGVIGIGLCTETLFYPLLFGLIFAIYYPGIIRREGIRLRELFGDAYVAYVRETPAFFPSFRRFSEPRQWQANPVLFRRHIINDTVFVFLAALLELIEGLREAGFIPHLLHVW